MRLFIEKIKSFFIPEIQFFIAFSLFLALVESGVPRPIPFFRLGLANLSLLIALSHFSFKEYLFLAIVKSIIVSILSGTLFSHLFLFSLGGSLSSALIMFLLYAIGRSSFSLPAISCVGAWVGNLTRLVLAVYLFLGESAWHLFLPMMIVGSISGWALGFIASKISFSKLRLQKFLDSFKDSKNLENSESLANSKKWTFFFQGVVVGSVFVGWIMLSDWRLRTLAVGGLFFLFLFLRKDAKSGVRLFFTWVFILIFNLFVPIGKELFHFKFISITDQALFRGFEKASLFVGFILISKLIFFSINLKDLKEGILGNLFFLLNALINSPDKVWRFLIQEDSRVFSDEMKKKGFFFHFEEWIARVIFSQNKQNLSLGLRNKGFLLLKIEKFLLYFIFGLIFMLLIIENMIV